MGGSSWLLLPQAHADALTCVGGEPSPPQGPTSLTCSSTSSSSSVPGVVHSHDASRAPTPPAARCLASCVAGGREVGSTPSAARCVAPCDAGGREVESCDAADFILEHACMEQAARADAAATAARVAREREVLSAARAAQRARRAVLAVESSVLGVPPSVLSAAAAMVAAAGVAAPASTSQ